MIRYIFNKKSKITKNQRKYDFFCVKSFGAKIDKLSIEKCFIPYKILTPSLWRYKEIFQKIFSWTKTLLIGRVTSTRTIENMQYLKKIKSTKWKSFISVKGTSDKTCNRIINVTDPLPGPLRSYWYQLRSHLMILMIFLRGVFTG